jgi:hypothetical protein
MASKPERIKMRELVFHNSCRLFFTLLLSLGLLFIACPGGDTPITGDRSFTIRIAGDTGQPFAGSYLLVKADGSIVTAAIEGTAPRDFRLEGLQVDATVQKTTATGYLEAQILRGRDVVAEGTITSAFGSINLTGR